jgi:hypothetical protein
LIHEGHGDLADSLQVEAKFVEAGGEEAGGSLRVESGVAYLVQNIDEDGRLTIQAVSPSVASTA